MFKKKKSTQHQEIEKLKAQVKALQEDKLRMQEEYNELLQDYQTLQFQWNNRPSCAG